MKSRHAIFAALLLSLVLAACKDSSAGSGYTPWGTPIEDDAHDGKTGSATIGLEDIMSNGELIMLTVSGPETYYDYHDHGMGTEYLLCEKFASNLGVSLRVEVCKDTAEVVRRLKAQEGDIAAIALPDSVSNVDYTEAKVDSARHGWAVRKGNAELAQAIDQWFKPDMVAQVRREERFLLSSGSVRRHVYAPMLNRKGGVISRYDHLFQRYAPMARWDWRLMAAQCYQESCFDPNAGSWAGAGGLMQIMPRTADHLGLARADITDPEKNIEAAARLIRELNAHFADVPAAERPYFVLAAYNAGQYHIRDAMALTKKNGGNQYHWDTVAEYVLKLSTPQYYNDPVVKYGYMRGSETYGYVRRIRARWAEYRGVAKAGSSSFVTTPHRATRNKYK